MSTDARGLATLAVLKTRFDEGKDHLGLFEPFVEDAVASCGATDFIAADIVKVIGARAGLSIPTNTVQTLLGRLSRRGVVQREGGRYLKGPTTATTIKLHDSTEDSGQGFAPLARAFVRFAQETAGVSLGDGDALAAIASFISDNKVPLMLEESVSDSPLERSSLSTKITRLVARFVAQHCTTDTEARTLLDALVEGMVLRDVLLLADIASLGRRFDKTVVVLDSSILFAAVDLTGVANGLATREGLGLLRETGAVTIAFDRTISEMRRILTVYENKLSTTEGRLSLYPTDLTHYVLTNRLSPSDVRLIAATLEARLAAYAIVVRPLPRHDRRFTLDEESLAKFLSDRPEESDSPRVRHDVDCVAGVLTLRAGRGATAVENCHAIFCTAAGRVVRSVQEWYVDQDEAGLPPIVHFLALSNIAWLKRPASAPHLKAHELAAVCASVLKPKRATWDKVIANLRGLKADGAITDDETVAVVASELMEPLLAELDDDEDPDADTINDAIERVRESYRHTAERAAATAIQLAKTDAALARQAASDAVQSRESFAAALEARAVKVARGAATVVYCVVTLVLIASTILSIPGVSDTIPNGWVLVVRIVTVAALGFGLVASMNGVSVNDLRRGLQDRFEEFLRVKAFGLPSRRG